MRFLSDNAAVVAVINSGSSRENSLMHLMCCLTFIMAKYNFVVSAAHIRGIHNDLADALSRNNTLSTGPSLSSGSIPGVGGAPTNCSARLGLPSLDEAVDRYFQSALAPASRREVTVPSDSALATHITFEDINVHTTTNPTLLKLRLKARSIP